MFFGDVALSIPKTIVDKRMADYQEMRKVAVHGLNDWANTNGNSWYKNKTLAEYYSANPCIRKIQGKVNGSPMWREFHVYIRTGIPTGHYSHDNVRWAHEELNALIKDYCSYQFWGVWDYHGDPNRPTSKWIWTEGNAWCWSETNGCPAYEGFGFEHYVKYDLNFNILRKSTDIINFLNTWYYKKDKINILDNI